MEEFKPRPEHKKFFDFADAIGDRVNDIGTKRGSRARSADAVTKRLCESADGDASKVTDEDIGKAFDAVDKEQ
jgi:hypothetical protein